ncbi:hypothetical protein M0R36_04725 [bacterium]|jgi:hypothetical protein|nr:hypothetical protein [bacterium]
MKKFLKFFAYFFGAVLTIIIIFLVGLTVYDSIQMHRLESKIVQLKLGDSREKAIQILGKPDYSWNKGEPEFTIFGKQKYYENSGMAYGKIMDWENAFYSDFPYFYPFKFRLFGPGKDDISIYFNGKDRISKIEMPKE